jgi:hypothetical protein
MIVSRLAWAKMRIYVQIPTVKKAEDLTQVIEHLLYLLCGKHKALV